MFLNLKFVGIGYVKNGLIKILIFIFYLFGVVLKYGNFFL